MMKTKKRLGLKGRDVLEVPRKKWNAARRLLPIIVLIWSVISMLWKRKPEEVDRRAKNVLHRRYRTNRAALPRKRRSRTKRKVVRVANRIRKRTRRATFVRLKPRFRFDLRIGKTLQNERPDEIECLLSAHVG